MADDLRLGAAKGAIAEHLSENLERIGAVGWRPAVSWGQAVG
jgi:hypothetical protein